MLITTNENETKQNANNSNFTGVSEDILCMSVSSRGLHRG